MDPAALAPFARVLLRYVGGALISAGLAINPSALNDPDLVQVICFLLGLICSGASEYWWTMARRRGWRQ